MYLGDIEVDGCEFARVSGSEGHEGASTDGGAESGGESEEEKSSFGGLIHVAEKCFVLLCYCEFLI